MLQSFRVPDPILGTCYSPRQCFLLEATRLNSAKKKALFQSGSAQVALHPTSYCFGSHLNVLGSPFSFVFEPNDFEMLS